MDRPLHADRACRWLSTFQRRVSPVIVLVIADEQVNQQILHMDVAGLPFHALLRDVTKEMPMVHVLDRQTKAKDGADVWHVVSSTEESVLLVAANIWFSKRAFANVAVRGFEAARAFAVIGETAGANGMQEDILGICLPAGAAHTLRSDAAKMASSVRDIAAAIGVQERTPATHLDPACPPRRVLDLVDVSAVEAAVLYERACDAMRAGIRIRDPHRVAIRGNLVCAAGVVIDVDVIIEGDVIIASGARIGPYCVLIDASIGANVHVNAYSIIERAIVGADSRVGPYGRLRPGASLGESVQIGNFVEVKNSTIGAGSRVNHLSFIGDATLGPKVTIGAGCITCNHDRVGVAHTTIEEGAYVGSGSELVAPIVIGKNATIGAGSTITSDAPAEALTLARARQVSVSSWVAPDRRDHTP